MIEDSKVTHVPMDKYPDLDLTEIPKEPSYDNSDMDESHPPSLAPLTAPKALLTVASTDAPTVSMFNAGTSSGKYGGPSPTPLALAAQIHQPRVPLRNSEQFHNLALRPT